MQRRNEVCKIADIPFLLKKNVLSCRQPNTTTCIMKFIKAKLGCSPNTMGRDHGSAAHATCDSGDHMTKLANISRLLDEADDTGIFDLTG